MRSPSPTEPHLDVTVRTAWLLMCFGSALGFVAGIAVGLAVR